MQNELIREAQRALRGQLNWKRGGSCYVSPVGQEAADKLRAIDLCGGCTGLGIRLKGSRRFDVNLSCAGGSDPVEVTRPVSLGMFPPCKTLPN